MTDVIKLGDIYVCRNKPVLTTAADGELFPVTISFAKSISDKKLRQLAALAKWLQDRKGETEDDEQQ